jgi:hypothetical protein
MSASSAPTLINLPPLPKPRTVNELANSINYTYREINRAFTIISRAFVFEKTLITGNVTTVGTQIGGFLISDTKLVSTDTVNGTQIGLYSAVGSGGAGAFSLTAGDIATSGAQASTIGNGLVYGHLVQVNNVVVAQMRRGLFNNHGYLRISKSDTTTVFEVDGSSNICTVHNDLNVTRFVTISGTGALVIQAGGFLQAGTYTPGAPAATGYVTFKDSAGNNRKFLVG